nr:hypothetical protein Q903MT_gene5227 [Picea sitchensis]
MPIGRALENILLFYLFFIYVISGSYLFTSLFFYYYLPTFGHHRWMDPPSWIEEL